LAISLAVIFGPAILIGLIGPSLEPHNDDDDSLYLLGVAYYAMMAIAVGVVLVVGYFLVAWVIRRARRSRSISDRPTA
jgi:hypothetical protein